jgi:hypothetical protein
VAFNDTAGVANNVTFTGVTGATSFTMSMAAALSNTFKTSIVPAPELIAELKSTAGTTTTTTNTARVVVTLTAPGAFRDGLTATNVAAYIKYPGWSGAAGTLTGLSATNVSSVTRGATPYNALTIWWYASTAFTGLTTAPAPNACQWGVDIGALKRKVKTVTGTFGSN